MSWQTKTEQLDPIAPEEKPEKQEGATPGNYWVDKNGKFLINKSGLELVKHFESCSLNAYLDPVNVWTIAWGRIRYPDGRSVKKGDACTQEEADSWLLHDLYEEGGKYIRSMTAMEDHLTEDQFSALVSFCYNRGCGRYDQKLDDLVDSGLADHHLTEAEAKKITDCILTYDWAGNPPKVLEGLARRRYAERELFNGGDWRKFDSIQKFTEFKKRGYKH